MAPGRGRSFFDVRGSSRGCVDTNASVLWDSGERAIGAVSRSFFPLSPVLRDSGERVGVRGLPAHIKNPVQKPFQILIHLMIPKPQHREATFFQISLTNQIVPFASLVRRSVQLDDQSHRGTVEVHNERIHHVLPTKLEPAEPAVTKVRPDDFLQRVGILP